MISYGSKKKVWIKCKRELHPSRLISVYEITKRQKCLCKQCNSFAQHCIDLYGDDFLDKYWDYQLNIAIDPWQVDHSSKKKVYIKCQCNDLHGSYLIDCNTFTSHFPNTGCPFCNVRGKNGRPIAQDSLGTIYGKSIHLWSDKNTSSPFEVTPSSHKQVWWKCENHLHDDYNRTISETVRYDFRCPTCVSESSCSVLQSKVASFIEKDLGYKIKHEYDCSIAPINPSGYNNIKMPYDNEVVDLKLIIEVHGKQHYSPCSWHTLTAKRNGTSMMDEFKKQQERDEYKKKYAIAKGYHYLAIPYYDEENDLYKQTILNKINEIYRIRNE